MRAVWTARRGGMAPPEGGDVMGSVATEPRRTGDLRLVRRTMATLGLGFGGGRACCSHAPSHRIYVGVDFENAWGRLLGAGLSGGCLLGGDPFCGRLLVSSAFQQLATWTSRPREGGNLALRLEGRSRP